MTAGSFLPVEALGDGVALGGLEMSSHYSCVK